MKLKLKIEEKFIFMSIIFRPNFPKVLKISKICSLYVKQKGNWRTVKKKTQKKFVFVFCKSSVSLLLLSGLSFPQYKSTNILKIALTVSPLHFKGGSRSFLPSPTGLVIVVRKHKFSKVLYERHKKKVVSICTVYLCTLITVSL